MRWVASLTQWTWVWSNWGESGVQRSPACCSPWACKELDTTEQLNNKNNLGTCIIMVLVQIFGPPEYVFVSARRKPITKHRFLSLGYRTKTFQFSPAVANQFVVSHYVLIMRTLPSFPFSSLLIFVF